MFASSGIRLAGRELPPLGSHGARRGRLAVLVLACAVVTACSQRGSRAPTLGRDATAAVPNCRSVVAEPPCTRETTPKLQDHPVPPTPDEHVAVEARDESEAPKPESNCDRDAGHPVVDAAAKRLIAELVRLRRPTTANGLPTDDGAATRVPSANIPRIEHISFELVRRLLGTFEKRATACGSALSAAIGSALNDAVAQIAQAGDDPTGPCVTLQTATSSPPKWVTWIGQRKPCDMSSHVPYVLEQSPVGITLLLAVDVGPAYSDGARVSPWHTLTFRAFSPGPTPDRPREILREQTSALWWEDTDVG